MRARETVTCLTVTFPKMNNLENYLNSVNGPKSVMISPTDNCNLSCIMCWRLDKEENPNLTNTELSFEELKKIIADCKKLGVKYIDLTGGGEAFLRKDIFDVIKLVKENGMKCSLTSNATLLNKERLQKIIDVKLDDICFSIESLKEEINDKIRGKKTLKGSVEAILELNKLKKTKLPVIRVATVITKINYMHLDSLIEFCIRNDVSAVNFSVLLEWDSNKHLSMRSEKRQKVGETLRKLHKKSEGKIYTNLGSLIKHGLFEHAHPKFCFAPWEMVFINSNGEVLACCTLASYYQNVIGNVKKESFFNIWKGKKMQSFRERMKRGEFFDRCNRCIPEFVDMFDRKYESLKILK